MKKFLTAIISAIAILACFSTSCSKQEDPDAKRQLAIAQVKSSDKLVLAQMSVSKMATVDDPKLKDAQNLRQAVEALGDAVKIGSRKAVYSYDTYLRAYLDLSTLTDADLAVEKNSVTLTLPAIQTEYAGRDIPITEEHYRVTGLRSQIGASERAALKEEMNKALKSEVENDSEFSDLLKTKAREKADAYFSSLLLEAGYSNVTVKFKD